MTKRIHEIWPTWVIILSLIVLFIGERVYSADDTVRIAAAALAAELLVKGSEDQVNRAFEDARLMGLVASWTHGPIDEEGISSVRAELSEGHQPEDLSSKLFAAGLGLRRMQPMENKLESLFVELTKEAA